MRPLFVGPGALLPESYACSHAAAQAAERVTIL